MNNTNENKTSDIYLAHVDFETGRTQSFQERFRNLSRRPHFFMMRGNSLMMCRKIFKIS